MATTYLQLANTKATGNTLAATEWNKTTASVDRAAIYSWKQGMNGILSGWALTSGLSTVTAGEGLVGPAWGRSTESQSISNLTTGSTNYVYGVTDAGSGASGTVDFKARTTSANLTNYDAVTSGLLVGYGTYTTGSGFTSVGTANRDTFPKYRREYEHFITAGDLRLPTSSGAHGSTIQASQAYTLARFPASSRTVAFWPVKLRPDYSGNITLRSYWLSRGVSNNIKLDLDAVVRGSDGAWIQTFTSTGAGAVAAISGTSGNMTVLSDTWDTTLPAARDIATVRIARDGGNASDTMAGDALLLAVGAEYNTQL